MPSIYDLFGNANGLKGLLSDSDIGSAQGDALLQAGLALMSAGGPSDRPVSFGQALAGAYGKGREAFQTGVQGQVNNQLLAQKIAEAKRQQKLNELLFNTQEQLNADMGGGTVSPQQELGANMGRIGPTPDRAAMIGASMPAGDPKVQAASLRKAATRLIGISPDTAKAYFESADRLDPPFEYAAKETELGEDGKPKTVLYGKRGQRQFTGGDPFIAPPSGITELETLSKRPDLFAMKERLAKAGATTIQMPSESERTAGFLVQRLQSGLESLSKASGLDPSVAKPDVGGEFVKKITGSDTLKNMAIPAQRQVIEAAQLEVLDSALTLGTGAAYTREQLEGYRQSYFPQTGDKPEVVQDKQKRLNNLLGAARIKSGRATPQDIGLPAGVTVERVK